MKKKFRMVIPIERSPFFVVEGLFGGQFLDLLWNWGEPLDMDPMAIVRLIRESAPGELIVGRRMTDAERSLLCSRRFDADSEAFAYVMKNDQARWRPIKRKRRRMP